MKPYQIVDRINLLYGSEYPMLKELERVVNTEELSSIFMLSNYLLGKNHRLPVNALMNLVYEREDDSNVFVLFKVIIAISQNIDALDALRNFMALDDINRNSLYLIFKVLFAIYPDEEEYLNNLKNVVCADKGDYTRDQIFLLFNVIEKTLGESEVLTALKNVCATPRYVTLQTELLFRLIMSFSDPDSETLDALKNIISVEQVPDLFLLFKVIQSIDPDCEHIALLKSATIFKTNILNLASVILNERFIIPKNLKKMISRFEGDALVDAFSRGQLQSKLWLVETIKKLELNLGNMIYVCAGWYGVLPALMFERLDIDGKIYSFDIDPTTDNPADTLNKEYIIENMSFKSFVFDVRELTFSKQVIPINHYRYNDAINFEKQSGLQEIDPPTCVINTSCEHIENFNSWWNTIPAGMLVIMQNNNFVEHDDDTVVNTVTSQNEWTERLNLTHVMYEGTLSLEKYNRYMVIGIK